MGITQYESNISQGMCYGLTRNTGSYGGTRATNCQSACRFHYQIFEIKHSKEAVPQQYRHLIDKEKCAQTEHRYGPITAKFVLYCGENQVVDGVQYQNVEEYLLNLRIAKS